jgi:hypothetical protein
MAANAEVTQQFQDMGSKFGLDVKVVEWLLETAGLGAIALKDFLFCVRDAAEIADLTTVIMKAKQIDESEKWNVTSRIRQAWISLKEAQDQASVVRKRGVDQTDLDELLHQDDLDDLQGMFWNRHKMMFPPEINPGDMLVSRLHREVTKRLLSVREVERVKSQQQQRMSSRKKQRVCEGLELLTGQADDEWDAIGDVQDYLLKLWTLMVAYAMAGCKPLAGAPQPNKEMKDKTYEAVNCPLDIVMKYHTRATLRVRGLPARQALEWLHTRDIAERTMWVDKYRNSDKPLGLVIEEVFNMREGLWNPPEAVVAIPAGGGGGGGGGGHGAGYGNGGNGAAANGGGGAKGGKDGKGGKGGKGGGKGGQGGGKAQMKTQMQMKDGTKLCPDFQQHKCKMQKDQRCPKGLHRCAAQMKGGRVCGGPHTPDNCHNKNILRK